MLRHCSRICSTPLLSVSEPIAPQPRRAPLPIARYDYELPEELIAQEPIEPRDAARLLVVDRSAGSLSDRGIRDLPSLLRPTDLLVLNDTRVLPARLRLQRASGGQVELLLLRRREDQIWETLARPARRLRPDEPLFAAGEPVATWVGRDGDLGLVRILDEAQVDTLGEMPLPPYITSRLHDPERYQTVFARERGSAAAPTASLHFTPQLLNELTSMGVRIAWITLHVGLDTFQPVREEDALQHHIHAEWYAVSAETVSLLRQQRASGGRIVAVGTTAVRTLETVADEVLSDDPPRDLQGETRTYITPGYEFRLVDVMQTNFHLPRTTLLLLVAAFAGDEQMRAAYAHAVAQRYRFYSFGDAMLIV